MYVADWSTPWKYVFQLLCGNLISKFQGALLKFIPE